MINPGSASWSGLRHCHLQLSMLPLCQEWSPYHGGGTVESNVCWFLSCCTLQAEFKLNGCGWLYQITSKEPKLPLEVSCQVLVWALHLARGLCLGTVCFTPRLSFFFPCQILSAKGRTVSLSKEERQIHAATWHVRAQNLLWGGMLCCRRECCNVWQHTRWGKKERQRNDCSDWSQSQALMCRLAWCVWYEWYSK